MLYATANYNANCASNAKWDNNLNQCVSSSANVKVTISPYVDSSSSQKKAKVASGDPVTLIWTSNNTTGCSCRDEKGRDCFNDFPANCTGSSCIYTKYTKPTTTAGFIEVYPQEYTKFSISCK